MFSEALLQKENAHFYEKLFSMTAIHVLSSLSLMK